MMIQKYKCDFCGKEQDDNSTWIGLRRSNDAVVVSSFPPQMVTYGVSIIYNGDVISNKDQFDFCKVGCLSAFITK